MERPTQFFKYTSAETAAKILDSSTFRYSSPLLFNDPFDVQTGLHFDFDVSQLHENIWNEIERIVLQEQRPVFADASYIGKSIALMWEKRSTQGFPREAMRSILLPQISKVVAELADLQTKIQNHWRQNFLPRLRVFCVSEEKDNLLMWAHYAKDHTGVVFELSVLPNEDNPLCVAKPVQYCVVPPALFSEKHWIDFVLERTDLKEEQFFLEYAYMKSDIWKYESEWRVWDLGDDTKPPHFAPYPIWENEIKAIYFGCRIESDKKSQIMQLLARYPKAKAFRSRRVPDEYKIEFDAISD